MDRRVRVRFAPSPTGPLHIGGARSALFNWLFARKNGGDFVVRVEDTDVERSTLVSEEVILDDLKWLGMAWDEGVLVGGENGPYRQSERLSLYSTYWERLLEEKKAYPCYCTEEELEAERESLRNKGQMPRYLGRCRDLTLEQRQKLENEGKKPTVRFQVPQGEIIPVEDLVRGRVEFESDGIGDFVIVKSDGIPTYNFAVVVDDALMKISHVIRGEEHLSNTPRQIMIYKALGFDMPEFAHISLILGEDRSKMSKRHGATSIQQYREKGYLPHALLNFLSLLGWAPEGEREVFSLSELVQEFSLDRVSKSPAVFNLKKLNWMNSEYIKKEAPEVIAGLALPYLVEAGLLEQDLTDEQNDWLVKVISLLQEQLHFIEEVVSFIQVFFGDKIDAFTPEALEMMKEESSPRVVERFREQILQEENWEVPSIKAIFKGIGKELGVGGKKLFQPVRAGLTGSLEGPDLQNLILLLGRERVAMRLAFTLEALEHNF
ncbi:glutamate--tRNA ligase [Candidatus Contubernalis alkalaceticus]|nr:glutamate--tRNA ligase [Candidatus Contubernalis alkalaceticus]UNC93350.1 glutamate--tRNA ligase [Candidatus Contubernalis alkalaceticus]